jgi:hypothetical protein
MWCLVEDCLWVVKAHGADHVVTTVEILACVLGVWCGLSRSGRILQRVCWRSQTTIFNRQLFSKIGEINILLNYWPSFACIRENMFCQRHLRDQVENKQNQTKSTMQKAYFRMRKGEEWRSPPTHHIWAKAPTWTGSRSIQEPTRWRLSRGGTIASSRAQLPTTVACHHVEAVHSSFLIFQSQTNSVTSISRELVSPVQIHIIWSYTSYHLLYSFSS